MKLFVSNYMLAIWILHTFIKKQVCKYLLQEEILLDFDDK